MSTRRYPAFEEQAQLNLNRFAADEVSVPAALDGGKRPSYIADHRARLRARFQNGGADAMPDYELLELFLFHILKRQDTKPIARALLDKFNDLSGITSASQGALKSVEGVGPAIALELKILEAICQRISRSKVINRDVVSSWDALVAYCRSSMALRDHEQFRVLFLDRKNRLIADELLGQGTLDHVPVYPREIVKRVVDLSAAAIILVHNHPSGDPTPSQADIAMTQKIQLLCDALGVTLHDHIIVGAQGEVSFRADGFL